MFRRRLGRPSLDQLYQPLRLPKRSANRGGGFAKECARLRHWSYGITLTTAVATVIALIIRGWHDRFALEIIASTSVLAFLWAYLLARVSHHPYVLQHLDEVLWFNGAVLLVLVTVILSMTGGSLSPLFWAYVILIVVEGLQDRRRGVAVAWLSWASFCAMILGQMMQWLPDERTGVSPEARLLGVTRTWHVIGIAVWYGMLAIAVSIWARWVGRYEQAIRERQDALAERERAVESERTMAGQQTFQVNQSRRQLESERLRWEQDRQQWERQRAEAAQQLADQDHASAQRMRTDEERHRQLQALQQQYDEAQQVWEQQRTRTTKQLDDRDAALGERERAFGEAQHSFETQRSQTTSSLMELEATLLASLKRIGDETAQLEEKRQACETAEREFLTRQAQWTEEQARARQDLDTQMGGIAHEAQALDRVKEAFAQTQQRALAELKQQQEEAHERLARVQAAEHKFQTRQQHADTQQAQQHATLDQHESALAQRAAALDATAKQLEHDTQACEHAQSQAEALRQDLQQRTTALEQQRAQLATEQHVLEQERARILDETRHQEQHLDARAAQCAAQEQALDALRTQVAQQVTALDARQRLLTEEHAQWERQRHEAARALTAPRGFFVQHARRALQAQARRLREEGREITQQRKALALREQQVEQRTLELTRIEHHTQVTRQAADTERGRLLQQLRARELELAERLRDVGNATRQLDTERAVLEEARRQLETSTRAKSSQAQEQLRAQAEELRVTRRQLEHAQRAFAEDQKAYERASRAWHEDKQRAEQTTAKQVEMLTAQRLALEERERQLSQEREALEHAHGRNSAQLAQQEKQLTTRLRQLEEREQQLARTTHELDEQQQALDVQRQQHSQGSVVGEQELAVRLEQVTVIEHQLDADRGDLQRRREQLDDDRQRLQEQQHQLETTQQQVHTARRSLADASLHHAPEPVSSETATLLANEFNVPLASLNALLSTLLQGDHGTVPPPLREALQDVVSTHERLRRIVSDVLDAARLEASELPISIQPITLHDLLIPIEQEIEPACLHKGLTLTREGNDALVVDVDVPHARRIVRAILHNAMQYTVRGGVTVTCSTEHDGVIVTIADTGVGIQVGQLGQLFAKPKLGSLLRGKGMSLFLARGLAKAMGGDLTLITSELEAGSTFAVTLPKSTLAPLQPADAPTLAEAPSSE